MKNIFYTFVTITALLMNVSCSNDEQIIAVAEKYVSEQICPLLPNASISQYAPAKPINPISEINDVIKRANLVNTFEENLMDSKAFDAKYINYNTMDQYKNLIILHSLYQSDIDALMKGDVDEGFYQVFVNIKYANDKYASFYIAVSKKMEVINTPIDISKVNNIVDEVSKYHIEGNDKIVF